MGIGRTRWGTNNGAATGATFSTSAKLGSACGYFNGSSYVDCGTGASLNITQGLTIELWFKRNSAGIFERLVSKEWNNAYLDIGYYIQTDNVNGIEFGVGRSDQSYQTMYGLGHSGIVAVGVWHHVVATYDGVKLKQYFNGVFDASVNAVESTIPAQGANDRLYIGRLKYQDAFYCNFDGLIDEVAIYNRALSASEVMNHYQNANPGTVKFQFRADTTAVPTGNFTGPDSTTATFYETTNSSLGNQFNGKRYLQYRAYFE